MDFVINPRNGAAFYISTINYILRDGLPRNGFQWQGGEYFLKLGKLLFCWTPADWQVRAMAG